MPPINRRGFLRESLSTTAVLTLPFLARGADGVPAPSVGDAAAAALRRMKEENKPGLVLVLPTAAEPLQARLAVLSAWLGGWERPRDACAEEKTPAAAQADAGAAVRQLLCQAVVVCVLQPEARDRWGLKDDTLYAVLTPDGRLQAESAAAEKPARLTATLTDLLHGPEGELRTACARRQKAALGEAGAARLTQALHDLEAADFARRQDAGERLEGVAAKAPAVLADVLAGKPNLDLRSRVEQAFDAVYRDAPKDQPGPRQPFGARWERKDIPSPPCGLACPSPSARLFLRVFTETRP